MISKIKIFITTVTHDYNLHMIGSCAHSNFNRSSKMTVKTLKTSPFLIINVCYPHFEVAVAALKSPYIRYRIQYYRRCFKRKITFYV